MSNHLANETSPYLLQHAENPVDWFPWNKTALDKAEKEDKPIFLSIGYAACHWCHVMEHESFIDPNIADILNKHFISIKVDREERPDLDSIYMSAVVAMTGQGGWPMSVFLAPDGKPFFGGTYFPPTSRYGLPAFSNLLLQIADLWKNKRGDLLISAKKITQHIKDTTMWNTDGHESISPKYTQKAFENLSVSYDWDYGGWGNAPRFPAPMTIEFLLMQAKRGNKKALEISEHILQIMARGGLYDVIGGGFHRYSTDNHWLVPHFEKMLYDNAQLSRVYLHAYLQTGNDVYRRVCEETLNFIAREMTSPEGGFYSSLDADSEEQEGKYYVWSLDELESALVNPLDREFLSTVYAYPPGGNFEGKIIFQRPTNLNDAQIAQNVNMTLQEFWENLDRIHNTLLRFRNNRKRPLTDDKILVFWNALTIQVFSEAARYLNKPAYLEIAQKNAAFLLNNLYQQESLHRSWRLGKAKYQAFLEDYASLILALLSLYQTDLDNTWYEAASQLIIEMVDQFKDTAGGFFNIRHDHENLIVRPKDYQDNATPSGNALAAYALLQFSAFSEDSGLKTLGEELVASLQQTTSRYPTSFSMWLQAMDFSNGPVKQVALLWETDQENDLGSFQKEIWRHFRPHLILAGDKTPVANTSPALLKNRPLLGGAITAYICEGFVCKQPVTNPSELKDQLEDKR